MNHLKTTCFYSLLLLLFFGNTTFAQDTTQYVVEGRVNADSQQTKPYVILISADGFRYDLARRYHAKNLLRLSNSGVEAISMQPSYPSLTFPNHYTIATGLYPSHHGIVDNRFYAPNLKKVYAINKKKEVRDGSWYGGVPLWALAEKQKMLSASFFWVGSESDAAGIRPTYYFNYSEGFSFQRRLEILKSWLQLPEAKRPHFISFYFPQVDHAEHRHGVYSQEAKEAVLFVDDAIGQINDMCAATGLPINIIFVSDHGFTNVDTVNTLEVPRVDKEKFIVSYGTSIVHLYAKNKKDVMATYHSIKKNQKGYKAYLKTNVPKKWHYGANDDWHNRIGDIILVADLPNIFYVKGRKSVAGHGYDNFSQEMQATFYAWGPLFKENLKINNFQNVHIYPLIAHVLGLHFDPESIDGKLNVLKKILKNE